MMHHGSATHATSGRRIGFVRPVDAFLICAAVGAIATIDARSRLSPLLPGAGSAGEAQSDAFARGMTVGALPIGTVSFAGVDTAPRGVTDARGPQRR